MTQVLETSGKYRQRKIRVLKKLYGEFNATVPERVLTYSRCQMQNVIDMLKIESQNPTLKTDEMFDIIETLPATRRVEGVYTKRKTDLVVGNIHSEIQALKIVVSLSKPSKMPCYGYSLPTQNCIAGSKLAQLENTICHDCYAKSNWYNQEWVKNAMIARLKAIWHPDWVDAMIWLLTFYNQTIFRWHDSGDLQSVQHLANIIKIAVRMPDVKFWLPTTDRMIVKKYWENYAMEKKLDKLYPNLCIRLSAIHFDEQPDIKLAKKMGVKTSMVSTNCPSCPAHEQNNKCLDCRNCWNQKMFCITYKKH